MSPSNYKLIFLCLTLIALTSCQQAAPLIGPPKSGDSPGRASNDLTDCERVISVQKLLTVSSPSNRKARYSGSMGGVSYNSDYIEETGSCNENGCPITMYTKDSAGNWAKVDSPLLNQSREDRIKSCETLGMKFLSSSLSERSITVDAGTFKSQCLLYSISMSFSVKNSQPYSSQTSQNSTNTVTTIEHCVSLEPASAGLLVQQSQNISGTYTDPDPKHSVSVQNLTPMVELLEIIK